MSSRSDNNKGLRPQRVIIFQRVLSLIFKQNLKLKHIRIIAKGTEKWSTFLAPSSTWIVMLKEKEYQLLLPYPC